MEFFHIDKNKQIQKHCGKIIFHKPCHLALCSPIIYLKAQIMQLHAELLQIGYIKWYYRLFKHKGKMYDYASHKLWEETKWFLRIIQGLTKVGD